MSCGQCGSSGYRAGAGAAYCACTGTANLSLGLSEGTLQNIAATAGASSSGALGWTMCVSIAFMLSRRFIYYKSAPGDCGSSTINLSGLSTDVGITAGLGAAAKADPEPISKSILAGIDTIFGGLTAAHAKAVANEQTTICQVATSYNAIAVQLEYAVQSGQLTPDQASQLLSQTISQLDGVLQTVQKTSGDAAAGYRVALNALLAYNQQVVYPALSPASGIAAAVPPPQASPGAPGTYPTGTGSPVTAGGLPLGTTITPGSPVTPVIPYQGASGPTPSPLTANNIGQGASSPLALPGNLPAGALILIGGVIYVASKPGAIA